MRTLLGLIVALSCSITLIPAADAGEDSPRPIAGFTAPEPGEHPRNIFRKADLPELCERAQTPQGQVVLDRARQMLDGRYMMTAISSETPQR